MRYEYTAIPAPLRGEKAREARTPGDRYALALTAELNRMAADGWEYMRADVLPAEERSGLTGRSTVYHNLLIFRRASGAATPGGAQPAAADTAPPATAARDEAPLPPADPAPRREAAARDEEAPAPAADRAEPVTTGGSSDN
ncbi:DUF4177 domain-containing protein [Paracoccus marinaquae]|uniref:DUF4177 domain-containing protein n=1 Tax=Paracoccus marinaquae TaxID=2841926 RepID=A0ABS6AMN2_9RHOB|nr:DUF4177 domain-containing protein [Paracoccus marinaquae]MBU3031451.1 DUF4177 domain-containing protein [Paracoccus marinaquae]